MKHRIYSFYILTCVMSYLYADEPLRGISFFMPRSQTTNAARSLVGWHRYINRGDVCGFYGAGTLLAEYGQSVHPDRISHALFGASSLTIAGSQVPNRGPNQIIADYFGLSPSFESIVSLEPLIRNAQFIGQMYFGYNWDCHGVYFRFKVPAVWTQWNFALEEEVFNNGADTPFPPLYMSQDAIPAPIQSFTDAFRGNVVFGDMQQPYAFGKIDGPQSRFGLSDLQFMIGYNIIAKQTGHAGFMAILQTPSGNTPTSEFFFEPMIGNGHHWECGLGFTGEVLLWESLWGPTFWFLTNLYFTHLFNTEQRRSFDLTPNGFGSRFILVKEFDESETYTRMLSPLINFTTLKCNVKIAFQADMVFMFSFIHGNFSFDFGYNGWLRSKEIITLKEGVESSFIGLKGFANVVTPGGMPDNDTQSNATLFADNIFINDPIPVFIRTDQINIDSAASPFVMTHKLFAHVQHQWDHDNNEYGFIPFLGVGGEIEFEGINTRDTPFLSRTTLNQWNFWLKGGISFG